MLHGHYTSLTKTKLASISLRYKSCRFKITVKILSANSPHRSYLLYVLLCDMLVAYGPLSLINHQAIYHIYVRQRPVTNIIRLKRNDVTL